MNTLNINIKNFFFTIIVLFFLGIKIANAQDDLLLYYKAIGEKTYNNPQKALTFIDSAIEISNSKAEYYILRGKIYSSLNQNQKATNDFLKAYKLSQNPASLYLAEIYSKTQKTDSAFFFLEKYLKWHHKKSEFEIKNDSNFTFITNTDKWNKIWEKNYYTPFQKEYNFALFTYKYNQAINALDATNKLIKKYKNFSDAYYLKALILFESKNFNQASKQCSKAIELNSNNADYYLLKARIYNSQKKYDKAVEQFDIYLKKNPYNPFVLDEYAKILSNAKMYEQALKNISIYCQVFYKDFDSKFQKAQIAYDAGEYLLTIKIINKLMQEDKITAEYYRLRGMAYLQANSFDLAYYDFSQALDINPTIDDVLYYRGNASYKKGDVQKACIDWKKAMEQGDYRPMDLYYDICNK